MKQIDLPAGNSPGLKDAACICVPFPGRKAVTAAGLSLLVLFGLMFFTATAQPAKQVSDPQATAQTKALFQNLHSHMAKGVLVGHQDDLAYGVGWQYQPGRSDIKDVTGDYPAVFGWELGNLELDLPKNLDGVPFDSMRQYIQFGRSNGAIITVSWHLHNPLTGASAWDPARGTVASLLPGGEKHALYNQWLDKLAVFFASLKDADGQPVPVIFRPYHEWNGDWFWWGKSHCSSEDFKALFRHTVLYLRQQKKLHHLLIAFNPDRFASEADYLDRYPGDDVVDVVGFDIYQRDSDHAKFVNDVHHMLDMLTAIANKHGKIPAITEFGYNRIPYDEWWTRALLPAISKHQLAWVLAWRNAGLKPDGETEFFMPYKGHASAPDFQRFYEAPQTLFLREAAALHYYHQDPKH